RGIFDNIRKFVRFLLACNFGGIFFMFAASVLGLPIPLFPKQLLWMNLITNGLPALALALEPPEPGLMKRKPRRPNAPLISPIMSAQILIGGVLIGLAALAAFLTEPDTARARSAAFNVLVLSQLVYAIVARSEWITVRRLGLF